MIMQRVVHYLAHLDGVQVGETHESNSRYFKMSSIRVRVSDHFAIKANLPTTLNIVCEGENFVVTYGNKLLPVKNYSALRQLLRNFAMVSDILAPLAETRSKVVKKAVVKKVNVSQPTSESFVPKQNDSDWLYIGDLQPKQKVGAYNNVQNMKLLSSRKKAKK